jgi:hypothetical protein
MAVAWIAWRDLEQTRQKSAAFRSESTRWPFGPFSGDGGTADGTSPTLHGVRDYVEAGGLMSYGPNFPDLFRRAGEYVDKILRGAKPGGIPVEQPTKFDLAINLTIAKALGLMIPESFLLRADEVIE